MDNETKFPEMLPADHPIVTAIGIIMDAARRSAGGTAQYDAIEQATALIFDSGAELYSMNVQMAPIVRGQDERIETLTKRIRKLAFIADDLKKRATGALMLLDDADLDFEPSDFDIE